MASTGSGAEEKELWSSFLPLMGEEARKRGYDLPLPFGVNINFLLLERDIEVTDVEAIRDHVVGEAITFQEGYPPDDDITLVVGRVA